MKTLVQYIYESNDKGLKFLFNKSDYEITINCKYFTISFNVENINYKTINDELVISGKEVLAVIEEKDNLSFETIRKLIEERSDKFAKTQSDNLDLRNMEFIFEINDAKIMPPTFEKLEKLKIEFYQVCNLKLIQKNKVINPEITFDDLHITGIGKLDSGKFLNYFAKRANKLTADINSLIGAFVDLQETRIKGNLQKIVETGLSKSKENVEIKK